MKWVSPSIKVARLAGPRPGMTVMDFGCGAGRVSRHLAELVGPSGVVECLDMQPKMLQKLEARMRRCQVRNFRAKHFQYGVSRFSDTKFDRILLVTVIGEVPDALGLLKQLCAHLAPEGLLSVTEVIPDPCYIRRSSLIAMCRLAGLQLKEEFRFPLTYTLNFVKASL